MSQGQDPFEFIKNFWANVPGMGNGGMGAMSGTAMPSFDPQDLEKRLGELKQVKQWLEMNLNMLNLQINTLEMQLSALNSFKGDKFGGSPKSAPSGAPDLRQANEATNEAMKAASEASAEAIAQGAQALQSMPWANPGEWLKSMQAAFTTPNAAAPAPKKRAAAKRSTGKKTASRSTAPPAARSAARPASSRRGTKSGPGRG